MEFCYNPLLIKKGYLMKEKDLLLKGVCCLMLLQVNGEAKGNTQIRSAQKDLTYLEKGFPMGPSAPFFPKTALPMKSESEVFVPSKPKFVGPRTSVSAFQQKKDKKVFNTPFVQRKMNMAAHGKNKGAKNSVRSVENVQRTKSASFQWTRISTQRGGKALLNRSVANRLYVER